MQIQNSRSIRRAARALALVAVLLVTGCSSKSSTSATPTGTAASAPTVAATSPAPTPTLGPSDLIGHPNGIAVDASGNVYFSTSDTCLIRKLSAGVVTKVAGAPSGHGCGSSADGPGLDMQLDHPLGVEVDPAGNVYIADYANCIVRKLSGGMITTIAGVGTHQCVYGADSGPARSVNIYPADVAVATDGSIYIADWANCRIRRLSDGTITTVAGVGTGLLAGCGNAGDGGPATAAQLNKPFGVAVDARGGVYISDTFNCRIRVVRGGTISTLAGTGAGAPGGCTSSGDGGPAAAAGIGSPIGIAIDAAGDVYIVDSYNCNVRKVSGAGTITTIAGSTGSPAEACGFAGDAGLATSAKLNHPGGIAVGADGGLYIADTDNCRVRKVTAGLITTIAGSNACEAGAKQ
jgi:sugar lactone lactonase YvrE